jgi:hypothetical protein
MELESAVVAVAAEQCSFCMHNCKKTLQIVHDSYFEYTTAACRRTAISCLDLCLNVEITLDFSERRPCVDLVLYLFAAPPYRLYVDC